MNEEIERIKNRIKNKKINTQSISNNITYFKNLLSRVLITIILVLLSAIYINQNEDNYLKYEKVVFTNNISFAKFNNWYQKKFGKIIPIDVESETEMVFGEEMTYSEITEYYDGYKLTLNNNIINAINSGIIVYMGEKEHYGNVIIVQGIDGADIWYGNINATDIALYDYIEKGTIIGESKEDYIYVVVSKDGEYLNYEEYIKEI